MTMTITEIRMNKNENEKSEDGIEQLTKNKNNSAIYMYLADPIFSIYLYILNDNINKNYETALNYLT
jgi:hypothetical protein